MVAKRLEKGFMLLYIMVFAETVDDRCCHFHAVLVQPIQENAFALFLDFSGIAAQDSLNLALCLGCADKIDPCLLYMLTLGCEDFYLVSTLQLVAQWYQLVVYLGSYTVASQEGMYLEGKVERRTSCRHCLDFSLRSKYEDF